jgi:hypothetical protein
MKDPPRHLNPAQFSSEDEYVDATIMQLHKHQMDNPDYIPRSARRDEVYARWVYRNQSNLNPN